MVRSNKTTSVLESNYYLVLTTSATLLLFKRNSPYAPVNTHEISKIAEISDDDKILLNQFEHGPTLVHPLPKLFLGLEQTKLPIAYSAWDFQRGNIIKLSQKDKIETELTIKRVVTARGNQETFKLILKSEPTPSHSEKPLFVRGEYVLFFGIEKLILNKIEEPLSKLLSKMRRATDFPFADDLKLGKYQLVLDDIYIGQLDVIINQLKTSTKLTLDPVLANINIESNPKLVLCAEHYSDNILGERFSIKPILDFGFIREDISETYYRSTVNGKVQVLRRAPHMHYISEKDGKLTLALVNTNIAEHFYKILFLNAKSLGLSSNLECRISGDKRISTFLNETWPNLLAFSNENGLEVTLNNNKLSNEHALFRADFAVDINEETNELSFEVLCYIGDKSISIEKLRNFVEDGGTHIILDDGTSVQIDNNSELTRFVRMLKSFHSRENSFVGKIYHAPELKYVMTCSPYYNSKCAESFRHFTENAEKSVPIKEAKIPEHLKDIMRPYQKDGVSWMNFLKSYRFGGILADDMGLGKTLQALAFLNENKIDNKPHLVVCPKTLIYNWASEANKFTPDLKVVTIDGTLNERIESQKKAKGADLIITSYSALLADKMWHTESSAIYNYVVLDEAQFIKNHTSKTAMLVKKLNAEYRLALTGTPLENNVVEIWSIMDFLMPNFLGHYNDFMDRYGKPIMQTNDSYALDQLKHKISIFMLRRTKGEVLKELPPKIEQHTPVALSTDQKVLYNEILNQVRKNIESIVAEKGFARSQIHILSGLMKLRQVCNHPALLLEENDPARNEVTSAKLDLAIELIEEAVAGNTEGIENPHKVLVFSQFTQMLDIISKTLNEKGIKHLTLTGKTQNRGDLVNKFNTDKETCVFLISTKAGGTGLNLASADTVVLVDPWWNPSVERQAIDRAHRIGQTRSVNVYKLITTGTVEEKIQALQAKKKDLFDALVSETGANLSKLTWDDVKSLFQ